jgi:uncharacterized protein
MFSLAVVLFFSATGLTLNHPAWFSGVEVSSEANGALDVDWLRDESHKLEVVERLRAAHRVSGALAEFTMNEAECLVTFKGPGYSADAFIDRATGEYTLSETRQGLVAVLNDLHKGRDSGPIWSILIDVSAIAMVLISLSGLILLLYLKIRRRPGLAIAILGTIAALLLVWWCVP